MDVVDHLQLGDGVFWIKFLPVLFGALTMVVVWKAIGEELKFICAHSWSDGRFLFSACAVYSLISQTLSTFYAGPSYTFTLLNTLVLHQWLSWQPDILPMGFPEQV